MISLEAQSYGVPSVTYGVESIPFSQNNADIKPLLGLQNVTPVIFNLQTSIIAPNKGVTAVSLLYGVNDSNPNLREAINAVSSDTDNIPSSTSRSLLGVRNYTFLYDQDNDNFDRQRCGTNDVDNITPRPVGSADTRAWMFAFSGAGFDRVRSQGNDADNISEESSGVIKSASYAFNYNPESQNFDRVRGNYNLPVIELSTSVDPQNVALENPNGRGIKVVLDLISITGDVQFAVAGTAGTSSVYPILQSATISSAGVYVLTVYPSATDVANEKVGDVLPRNFQVSVNPTATAIQYRVDATIIV